MVQVKESSFDISSVKYQLAQSLVDVNSTSKIFLLQESADEKFEILFGDGIFGNRLENGNVITTTYVITNGDLGNGASNFTFSGRLVDNDDRVVTTGVSAISVISPAQGGGEIESTDSIRKYAPLKYASQNRAVTNQDYEVLTKQVFADTESVSAFGGEDLDPPQYGRVFIAIKPKNGNYLSNFVKSSIIDDLKRYTVAGISPRIIDLKYLYVEIDSNVYYNTNQFPSSSSLKTKVMECLDIYSKTAELNTYGARLKYSKLLRVIDDCDSSITSNITTVKIRRDLRPVLNSFSEYELCYGNRFHVIDGQNIKTSGFFVEGYAGEVFLSDAPYSDMRSGTIDLIRAISDTEMQVLRRDVGTIDYIKGEILLSPIKITGTSKSVAEFPVIEVQAIPYSNDVIGLQDLFLQLDISKSNVTVVSDTMSSGADVSGSRYTVSSSFSNGKITR